MWYTDEVFPFRNTEGIHMLIRGLALIVEVEHSKSDKLEISSSVSLLPGSCKHETCTVNYNNFTFLPFIMIYVL